MTKALDKTNEKARSKANDKPYYKLIMDYVRACPYCDAQLHSNGMEMTCECGIWVASWIDMTYTYTKKEQQDDNS